MTSFSLKSKTKLVELLFLLTLVLLYSCQSKDESSTRSTQSSPALCNGFSQEIDMSSLSSPVFLDKIGNSQLDITTDNKEVQKWFNQGLNLLHGFWHIEAYRAFKEALKLDPNCAMAYWGIAMCQPGFGTTDNKEWIEEIDKAYALQADLKPIEKGLIKASHSMLHNGIINSTNEWQSLIQNFHSEPEAIAFAGIMLRQAIDSQNKSDAIKNLLELGQERFPDHTALQHYYTHIMETRPDFILAKKASKAMSQTAPNSPHIVHMAGHIFFLEGKYDEAADAFEKSYTLEKKYHKENNIPFIANQNYLHNLHYLAVTYLEMNEGKKALEIADSYAKISLAASRTTNVNNLLLLYEGRLLPALISIRLRDWKEAKERLEYWINIETSSNNPLIMSYLRTMLFFIKGMNALEKENTTLALQALQQLNQEVEIFEKEGIKKKGTVEFELINQTFDIMKMASYELEGWTDNVDATKPFNPQALLKAKDLEQYIPYNEPPRLMYPIAESVGLLFLKRKEKKAAKNAFDDALSARPKSLIINSYLQ